jgi:phenylacetate-CoA ligase
MPSVESIKELIYTDHAVAEQLTGAFRLAKGDAGGVQLTLQASSERVAEGAALRQQLVTLARSQLSVPLDLEIMAPLAFPYRPLLDFERKFAYLDPL